MVELAPENPEMLPGMTEIHDLNGAGELLLTSVPDPVAPSPMTTLVCARLQPR